MMIISEDEDGKLPLQNLMAVISGSDITISGNLVSGKKYQDRQLDNVTLKEQHPGQYSVVGWDPAAEAVRCFRLDLISDLRLVGGPALVSHGKPLECVLEFLANEPLEPSTKSPKPVVSSVEAL